MWCAVSVDARLDVNVALNRPAYQPSTYLDSYIAGYNNDGNNHTNMVNGPCASTDSEVNPWWAVDLVVALYVVGVKYTSRDVNGTKSNIFKIIGVDLSPRLVDIAGGLGNGSPPRRPGVEPR